VIAMPTYEYVCTKCDTHVEVFQRIGEDPLTDCGVCDGTLRKVFHPAGILFKGSGFYKTDSRSTSSKAGSKPSESKVSESKPSESKGSDSKGSDSKGSDSKGSESSSKSDSKPAREKTA
jgi:putative FmdB family regulatory protein